MSWIFAAKTVQKISTIFQSYGGKFSRKQLESNELPPTFSEFKYMIHRSHFITYICKSAINTNSILPDPENFGWKKIDDEYKPFMTNFLLLSRWSNLVCVHARKQTAILYVAIARKKGWCVLICVNVWTVEILNLISLNS